MTTDELQAKFETMFSQPPYEWDFTLFHDGSGWPGSYAGYHVQCAWEGWQAAHASRDAEVEALKRDAERYRWLLDTGLDDGNGWHLTQELPNGMEEIHLFADRINDAIDAAMAKESGE